MEEILINPSACQFWDASLVLILFNTKPDTNIYLFFKAAFSLFILTKHKGQIPLSLELNATEIDNMDITFAFKMSLNVRNVG